MAARPWRVIGVSLALAVTAWIWTLAGALFLLRWIAVDRPPPPPPPLLPYGEMRIGVDASYPPFAAVADDLYGLEIDLGRMIASRLNAPVRFINMGFDGLYDSLKADQVDLVLSALVIDASRMGDVRYTLPYFNAGLVLVSPAAKPVQAVDQLPGRRIALEFASEADQLARVWLRRVPPFVILPYELPDHALDSARRGIADAALVDAVSARLYLRLHPDWRAASQHVTDVLYAGAVRSDRGALQRAIDQALAAMMEDGTLAQLVSRWL